MNNSNNMEKMIQEVDSVIEEEEKDYIVERFWKEARDVLNHDRESFQKLFTDNWDMVLVHSIVFQAPADIFRHLISPSNINMLDRYGMTPLHVSVLKQRWELVPILIQRGADVNCVNTCRVVSHDVNVYRGLTPLHLAVDNDAPIDVLTLLVSPHNINIQGRCGLTALHMAVVNQRMDMVSTLLQRGADVNVCDNHNTTPLLSAVDYGAPLDIITQLISPDTISMQDDHWDTPINLAVVENRWDLVSLLLRHGADVNMGDCPAGADTPVDMFIELTHPTTLHWAAEANTPVDIFTRLISRHNITMQCNYGNTALHVAVLLSRWDLVPILLQLGADVNLGNCWDRTPLHDAARNDAPERVFTLLISPLNINMRDEDGDTALQNAIEENSWDLVPALLQYGADPTMLDFPQIDQPLMLSLKSECILTIRCHMHDKSDEAFEDLGLPRKVVDDVKLRPQAYDIADRVFYE